MTILGVPNWEPIVLLYSSFFFFEEPSKWSQPLSNYCERNGLKCSHGGTQSQPDREKMHFTVIEYIIGYTQTGFYVSLTKKLYLGRWLVAGFYSIERIRKFTVLLVFEGTHCHAKAASTLHTENNRLTVLGHSCRILLRWEANGRTSR